ncbi:MAG TPA: TIGR03842 family LLM class F420-dependent oxidoreductase [Actinobacteria bacterium]|nr:TIGR03842 family LLM class F420-dependent oxidoreductase [Actinomycetota bacterium]
MEFGAVFQTDPPASEVVRRARLAEELGFDYVWTFDSHVLWEEPFVIYSRILEATERVVVGPLVTNPGTRDWTVLASLFATLNEMSGGRTICGMGRGDSALRVIGRRPMKLATMSEAMRVIKGLVAGEEVDYRGTPVRIPWIEEGWELPMWVAGYGPRALDLIGREADGFVLQLADPKILEWTVATVRAAAADAGRDPDEVKIAVVAPAFVGDDVAAQCEELRWFGGMVGNHVADLAARYGRDGGTIPRELMDYIEARESYDYSHHGKAGNPTTEFVTDEIVERFCILGPVERHLDKLRELAAIGADHVSLYLMHSNVEGTMAAYGESIIPVLGG